MNRSVKFPHPTPITQSMNQSAEFSLSLSQLNSQLYVLALLYAAHDSVMTEMSHEKKYWSRKNLLNRGRGEGEEGNSGNKGLHVVSHFLYRFLSVFLSFFLLYLSSSSLSSSSSSSSFLANFWSDKCLSARKGATPLKKKKKDIIDSFISAFEN